jgi:regulator of protease activity HflC (stomatin/prohibitin superfamily)
MSNADNGSASRPVAGRTGGSWLMGRGIGFLAIAAVLVVAGCNSFYTVEQGERGIVKLWGAITQIADPGLGFMLPFANTVENISVRTEKVSWERFAVYSKDVQAADLRVSVNVRLDPAFVREIYTTYGTNYVERTVWPVVPKVLEEVFGQYQATTVVSARTQLGLDFEKALRAKIPPGIIIESAQIENVDFSDNYERSIELAAQAEAMVRTKENEKRQAQVEAEKLIIEAEARKKSNNLETDARAYSIREQGNAEAQAIAARGQALRDSPNLVALTAAEKWDGKLPSTMIPGSTVPFVQMPQ